ncbi:MAG: helix-hairpin-helix domain-containing protein [Burkholderiales bacterium]|nr:helix-hairpin-helix domain-containing protein [Phycisphaerae bacterium]
MQGLTHHLTLTAAQRRAVLALLLILLGCLTFRAATRRAFVPALQPDAAPRAAELADQIDPNEADWPTLAVLPTIGPKRAQDIVAAREQLRRLHPDRPPFMSLADLDQHVKGIGQATIIKLQPYLRFPTTQPGAMRPGGDINVPSR